MLCPSNGTEREQNGLPKFGREAEKKKDKERNAKKRKLQVMIMTRPSQNEKEEEMNEYENKEWIAREIKRKDQG